jgi:hypothetical protein
VISDEVIGTSSDEALNIAERERQKLEDLLAKGNEGIFGEKEHVALQRLRDRCKALTKLRTDTASAVIKVYYFSCGNRMRCWCNVMCVIDASA